MIKNLINIEKKKIINLIIIDKILLYCKKILKINKWKKTEKNNIKIENFWNSTIFFEKYKKIKIFVKI